MTDQHPITPPPELVREWAKGCSPYDVPADHIATQAARWGADLLRSARRGKPKPPSLKEQALDELDRIQTHDENGQEIVDLSVIRRALEALPN